MNLLCFKTKGHLRQGYKKEYSTDATYRHTYTKKVLLYYIYILNNPILRNHLII